MPAPQAFLAYIRQQAEQMRKGDRIPTTKKAWLAQKKALRAKLVESWGGPFPKKPCPLQPRKLGTIDQPDYTIEKIVLQTRPGIWMTCNAYVPKQRANRLPGVLCVHGHWSRAKQEPVVQSRCAGLAKLGFFVLAVDAFGAGERGLKKPLGEYHGEMVASTLWPSGLSLSGLQVYENMRAVDYMLTRPEVDGKRLGVTGCSGGGNQTMYVGAFDERLKCVVPTCSVGTYESYLGVACCMCEVVPSALSYTEEWALLAMVAPRGLMITNATKDGIQFSVGKGKVSLTKAQKVFQLFGKTTRQTVVDSGHGYNKEMREAMYGFMTLHLKGKGNGSPIPEPAHATLHPEQLRCYPGDRRPNDFVTLPKFAAEEGRKILKRRAIPNHYEQWESDSLLMLDGLANRTLGAMPKRTDLRQKMRLVEQGKRRDIRFPSEPGIELNATHVRTAGKKLAIVLDLDGRREVERRPWLRSLQQKGYDTVTVDLRACGNHAHKGDAIARASDHNTAQWAMWIGRPLISQWTWDITRVIDAISETSGELATRTTVFATGPAANVALITAALDWRIQHVVAVNPLASYISDQPFAKGRVGILAPGILRHVGDVQHHAALIGPRQLTIAGAVNGQGKQLTAKQLQDQFKYTRKVFELEAAPKALTLLPDASTAALLRTL